MGLLRELSAQVVTLENMAFVELQTYSAHPVVVCLLVFTAAVAARLLVSRLPKNREERDGQVKIPQSLLILRRLSHFSWINIFHDCSKTLAKFQNSEQLDIFFLSVHLVVLWIFFRHSLHPFRRASLLLSFLLNSFYSSLPNSCLILKLHENSNHSYFKAVYYNFSCSDYDVLITITINIPLLDAEAKNFLIFIKI